MSSLPHISSSFIHGSSLPISLHALPLALFHSDSYSSDQNLRCACIRLQQNEFSKYNQSKGIIVTCYSPFGNQNEIYDKGKNMGKLMDEPVLVEIGKKYGKNGAQTALGTSFALLPLLSLPYPTFISISFHYEHK